MNKLLLIALAPFMILATFVSMIKRLFLDGGSTVFLLSFSLTAILWWSGYHKISIIVLFIIIFLLSLRFHANLKNHSHILNIIYAKYTFQLLDDSEKDAVIAVAAIILNRESFRNEHKKILALSEIQKYSTYALAMQELKIAPFDKHYSWSYVDRPLLIPEKLISKLPGALALFNKEHSTNLDIKID